MPFELFYSIFLNGILLKEFFAQNFDVSSVIREIFAQNFSALMKRKARQGLVGLVEKRIQTKEFIRFTINNFIDYKKNDRGYVFILASAISFYSY